MSTVTIAVKFALPEGVSADELIQELLNMGDGVEVFDRKGALVGQVVGHEGVLHE